MALSKHWQHIQYLRELKKLGLLHGQEIDTRLPETRLPEIKPPSQKQKKQGE